MSENSERTVSVVALTMLFRRWRHLLVFLGGLFFLEIVGQWIYFDDVLFGVALGVAIPVTAFRYFTPNEIFPVVYRRGRAAHVDVGGRRDVSGIQPEPSDKPGTRRFDGPPTVGPRFTGLRMYTFPGGCARYRFDFAPGASPLLATAVDGAVAFMPRVMLADYVRKTEGLTLCGRGAPCPG